VPTAVFGAGRRGRTRRTGPASKRARQFRSAFGAGSVDGAVASLLGLDGIVEVVELLSDDVAGAALLLSVAGVLGVVAAVLLSAGCADVEPCMLESLLVCAET
jgi:hypothetical protein